MTSRRPSKRYAEYLEIHDALRSAAEHLSTMMKDELVAAAALERGGDSEAATEATRQFFRSFKAFIAEVRSARDYMKTAAKKNKADTWLRNRFDASETAELFEFFNGLMNLTLHQYQPKLEPRSNKIQYVAEEGAQMLTTPLGILPSKMRVTGVADAKYHFTLDDLDFTSQEAFVKLQRRYFGETVIMLAARYRDVLAQILKNAERNGRFDSGDAESGRSKGLM